MDTKRPTTQQCCVSTSVMYKTCRHQRVPKSSLNPNTTERSVTHTQAQYHSELPDPKYSTPREREIYFKSHISLWEHSSHFRLIGRGVPSVSVVSQLMYKFLCLASPKENP